MAQILTLNGLNDLLKGFADGHLFLNDYGLGQTSEIGTSRQMKFPYMWCTLGDNTQITTTNKTSIPTVHFIIIFADQKNNQATGDDFNTLENLSDCFQIAQDLIATISSEWGKWGVVIQDTPRAYPVIDETQDAVNGWAMDLKLKLVHHNCTVPTKL